MSRYEPPIKKREQEKALENVRKMTNGGSKESESEKQAEGETELSWDHEGLEPYPGPEKSKPQRGPKESKLPNVTSVAFESKDDPTQMTKIVIYNYILYYIQKTIHSKLICTNVHS